jgi:hypothetical protein
MRVRIDSIIGGEAELWAVLFELHADMPAGWAVVGAQMVVLHAAAHGIPRPQRTRDVDVVVDLQTLQPASVADWLIRRDFKLAGSSGFGIGHEFQRGHLRIDVLASDHGGPRADRTTIPPARTVEVPGSRRAFHSIVPATVSVGEVEGQVPVPDWLAALILKARAALEFKQERARHLVDLALLLGLPVDLREFVAERSAKDRGTLSRAFELLDDEQWKLVASSVDPRAGRAAAALLTRE